MQTNNYLQCDTVVCIIIMTNTFVWLLVMIVGGWEKYDTMSTVSKNNQYDQTKCCDSTASLHCRFLSNNVNGTIRTIRGEDSIGTLIIYVIVIITITIKPEQCCSVRWNGGTIMSRRLDTIIMLVCFACIYIQILLTANVDDYIRRRRWLVREQILQLPILPDK
jgi:hypothetical protein